MNKDLARLQKTQKEHDLVVKELEDEKTVLSKQIIALENKINKKKEELKEQKQTNKELKQLFIDKDFEASGVKPSELKEKIIASYPNPKDMEGSQEIYAIQIAVYQNKVTINHFNDLNDVWYNESKHGAFMYMSGQFTSASEATAHKNLLVAKGYPNAFVVKLSK